MGRQRQYDRSGTGAPLLHVRVHPDVLEWIRTVKGYGWARAYLEAAYTAETGREVRFPNKARPDRKVQRAPETEE